MPEVSEIIMKQRIKINGFIILCAFVLIVAFPGIFLRNERAGGLESIAEVLGLAAILLGQILRVSARGYKAENSKQSQALIQGGPYSLVRNPMYLGILLIGLGMVLMLFQWWVAVVFTGFFIIRYISLIFKEEKKLLGFFPKEYPDYIRRVPRILPSLQSLFKKDIAEYFPLKPRWLKREIGSISAVLLVAIALEAWEDISAEGLKPYLNEAFAMIIMIMLFTCLALYLSKMSYEKTKNVSIQG